jgi:hypothetical protein
MTQLPVLQLAVWQSGLGAMQVVLYVQRKALHEPVSHGPGGAQLEKVQQFPPDRKIPPAQQTPPGTSVPAATGVEVQPVDWLQESVVHGLLSLQITGGKLQPVAALQSFSVQALLSSHSVCAATQIPPEQVLKSCSSWPLTTIQRFNASQSVWVSQQVSPTPTQTSPVTFLQHWARQQLPPQGVPPSS